MRTLERNKTTLWKVSYLGKNKIYDDEGYFTGEIRETYSEPEKINMMFQPTTGDVIERVFGKSVNVEMMSTSTIDLDHNDLIFLEEPTDDNYEKSYDYSITEKLPTLNSYIYGFKGRL